MHSFCQPGKFHFKGKSRHCCGLTSLMRQRGKSPSSKKIQEPFSASVSDNPVRSGRRQVYVSRKSFTSIPRNSAIASISPSFTFTQPSQRQQLPQRAHSNFIFIPRNCNPLGKSKLRQLFKHSVKKQFRRTRPRTDPDRSKPIELLQRQIGRS